MATPAIVKFDGGARPNPGPAAIGYIIETDDLTENGSHHIGKSTNIKAEYHALIRGLETARDRDCPAVEARGDSEAVVQQVRGEYGVSETSLRPLCDPAQGLAVEFE